MEPAELALTDEEIEVALHALSGLDKPVALPLRAMPHALALASKLAAEQRRRADKSRADAAVAAIQKAAVAPRPSPAKTAARVLEVVPPVAPPAEG